MLYFGREKKLTTLVIFNFHLITINVICMFDIVYDACML